jgi:hypothetical protein
VMFGWLVCVACELSTPTRYCMSSSGFQLLLQVRIDM